MPVHFRSPLLSDPRSIYGEAPMEFATAADGYETYVNHFTNAGDTTVASPATWVRTAIAGATADAFALLSATDGRGSMALYNPGTANTTGTSHAGAGFYLGPQGSARTYEWGFAAKFRVTSVANVTTAIGMSNGSAQLTSAGAFAAVNLLQVGFKTTNTGLLQVYLGNNTATSTVDSNETLANDELVSVALTSRMVISSGDVWTGGYINAYVNGIKVKNGTRNTTWVPGDRTIDLTTSPGLFQTIDAVNLTATTGDVELDYIGYWSRQVA